MATNKSQKRKRKFVLLGIILVAAVLTLVAVFQKKDDAILVQKEKVARRNLTELVVASGKIQPVVQVKLSSEVSGEIVELAVKEGQSVSKGALLLKIKPDPYIASKNSAEANYLLSLANKQTAEANLEKARLEFLRIEELSKHKLISESDYQTTKTAYTVAQASLAGVVQQVEMAQAQRAKANDDLAKTTIYSPITGTVTKLYSQVGERVVGTATMAGTDIMIVSDLSEMETRVDIGEIDVVLIGVGQNARLEVDAYKDRKFKGKVTEIANSSKGLGSGSSSAAAAAASSSSQEATKFEVKIRFLEKEPFRPGMSVTAEIETRSRTNVLSVPIQSVTTRMPKDPTAGTNSAMITTTNSAMAQGTNVDGKKSGEPIKPVEVVFVVEGDTVKMLPVKKGIANDDYYEIIEGLNEGQEVVSGGAKAIRDLEDGKKVTTGTGIAVGLPKSN